MNQTWAPGHVPAATRGEFLALRATAVQELERRIGSPSGLLVNCALVFGAAFALLIAGQALSDVRVETFHVVFAAVMTAAALATVPVMVRRARRTRTLMATLLAWETAERRARSLPPGHVRPDLRVPFDAKQDPDFEDVAHTAEIRAEFRPSARWLILRAFPAGIGLLLGVLLVLGGFSDAPAAVSVLRGAAGGYVLICSLVSITGMFRTARHLRRVWQVRRAEIRAWRIERIGPVAAADLERAVGRLRARRVAPLAVLSMLYLVLRVRTSSPEAVTIFVVIVVLAGLVTGVVLLVRRRRRRATAAAEQDLTSAVPPY